jgi:Lar family restriction alleviation protein
MMIAPLPCPFCGLSDVTVKEGSTFRWRVVECGGCGAQCGEIRRQTLGEGTVEEWESKGVEDAIAEWNTRT